MPSSQTSQPRPAQPIEGFSQLSSTKRISCSSGSIPSKRRLSRYNFEYFLERASSPLEIDGADTNGWDFLHNGRQPVGETAPHRRRSKAPVQLHVKVYGLMVPAPFRYHTPALAYSRYQTRTSVKSRSFLERLIYSLFSSFLTTH